MVSLSVAFHKGNIVKKFAVLCPLNSKNRLETFVYFALASALVLWLWPLTVFGGDSGTYFRWAVCRAPFYPILYKLATLCMGSAHALAALNLFQTTAAVAAALWLAAVMRKRFGIISAAAGLAVFIFPLYKYNWAQSEPLSIAFMAVFCALLTELAFAFSWKRWTLVCASAALSTLLRPQFFFLYPVLGIFALYHLRNTSKNAAGAIAIIAACLVAAALLENSVNAARFGFFGKHKRANSHVGSILLFISDGPADAALFKNRPDYPVIKVMYDFMSRNRLWLDWPLAVKAKSIPNYFEDLRALESTVMARRFGYDDTRQDAVWRGMVKTLLRKYWFRWLLFAGICLSQQPLVSVFNLTLFLGAFITVFLAFSRSQSEALKTLALCAAAAMFFNHFLIALTTGVFWRHYTMYSDMAVLAACAAALAWLPVLRICNGEVSDSSSLA